MFINKWLHFYVWLILFVTENSIKLNCPFQVINQTRERELLQDIRTPRSGSKKRGTAEIFNRLQVVWIPDETLFRVFDIASQTIHNS